jgi:hypothetical protein
VIAGPLVAAALAAACGPPTAAPGARPPRTGETLTYDLDLFGMVKAGDLELSVGRPMSAGKIVPLRARARTSAQVSSLKKLAAVGLSWVEAATLLPERYRDESEEGGVRRSSDARLRPPAAEVVIESQTGEAKGSARHERRGDVLDPVSTVYLLRAARLEPGDRFCFDAVGRGRYWRVEATVAPDREKVESPAGTFDTIRVDLVGRRADQPAGKAHEVHLWFSRDTRRLLVAAVAELDVGPASVTLTAAR